MINQSLISYLLKHNSSVGQNRRHKIKITLPHNYNKIITNFLLKIHLAIVYLKVTYNCTIYLQISQ